VDTVYNLYLQKYTAGPILVYKCSGWERAQKLCCEQD